MAEALRSRDRIDPSPRFAAADVAVLEQRFEGASAVDLLHAIVSEDWAGRVAVVSSFGAESAVLLHLIASADPALPVLFLDTGRHFPETLAYRDRLAVRLGLTDLRILHPDPHQLAARDAEAMRFAYDPDGCCEIRKVVPLARTLAGFDASITGRKAFQSLTREALPYFELDQGRLKINPLARWNRDDLQAYAAKHDLPAHPLVAQGYPSIGCEPCTSRVQPGEDLRSGRWRGLSKTECGIHAPVSRSAR